jgi:hypothetical protein
MFRLINIFVVLLLISSAWAQDDPCNSSECRYRLTLDRTGAYIAVVTLPSGQAEGLWSLTINPGQLEPQTGGYLDSYSGVGYGSFIINSPEEIEFLLSFGDSFGNLGASQPQLEIYYQYPDGTRELYWSSPVPSSGNTGDSTNTDTSENDTLVITKINDPRVNLATIATNDKRQKMIAIYGEKDSNGHLKKVTDIAYIPVANPESTINLSLLDDGLRVIEFPDGGTIKPKPYDPEKPKPYDPEKKKIDLVLVENNETGKTTELGTQDLYLPKNSCFDKPGDFGDVVADCLNKWAFETIDHIMATFCNMATDRNTSGILELLGMKNMLCNPLGTGGIEGIEVNCYTDPINNLFNIVNVPMDSLGALKCSFPLKLEPACIFNVFHLGQFAKGKISTSETSCDDLTPTEEFSFTVTCNGGNSCGDIPIGGKADLQVSYVNPNNDTGAISITGINMQTSSFKYDVPENLREKGTVDFYVSSTAPKYCTTWADGVVHVELRNTSGRQIGFAGITTGDLIGNGKGSWCAFKIIKK